jgi:hypothetical protein
MAAVIVRAIDQQPANATGAHLGEDDLLRAGREFNPDRKDTHWGKRKLKRDR